MTDIEILKKIWNLYFHEPISIKDEDFYLNWTHKSEDLLVTDDKNDCRIVGLVVDQTIKRFFLKENIQVSQRFDLFDIKLSEVFIEIKSSNAYVGNQYYVTLSQGELDHAKAELKRGMDTIYLFFDARVALKSILCLVGGTIEFVGAAWYSDVMDKIGYLDHIPGNTPGFNQALLSNDISILEHR